MTAVTGTFVALSMFILFSVASSEKVPVGDTPSRGNTTGEGLWHKAGTSFTVHSTPQTHFVVYTAVHFSDGIRYMSSRGHDMPGCGIAMISACKSLTWLLGEVQHRRNNVSQLIIITDTDIFINDAVMVRQNLQEYSPSFLTKIQKT